MHIFWNALEKMSNVRDNHYRGGNWMKFCIFTLWIKVSSGIITSCSTNWATRAHICATIKGSPILRAIWRCNRKSLASGTVGFIWNDDAKSSGPKGALCSLIRPPNHPPSLVYAALIKRMTGYGLRLVTKAPKKERWKEMESQRTVIAIRGTKCSKILSKKEFQ